MITALRIQGFRCFDRLTVEGLTQVSLLVGANNAGKTSVLEAAEVVLGGSNPSVIERSPRRRNELINDPARQAYRPVADHLFYGHQLEPGASFRIEARQDSGQRFLACTVIAREEPESRRPLQETPPMEELASWEEAASLEPALALLLQGDSLSADGYVTPLLGHALSGARPAGSPSHVAEPPIQFVTTATPTTSRLRALWDEVVLTPEEERVTDVLQLIEPGIERIAALSGSSPAAAGGIFVKLKGIEQRIPLGSMGEGIKRLLALSLSLTNAAGGYLLVDEIDTGLHHSVMVKMWRLVVEAATRLNVQVLATTHSLDCVHALAALYEESPQVWDLISLHRIERGTTSSVLYSAEEILAAARLQMELR